jgi:hypothetical protein
MESCLEFGTMTVSETILDGKRQRLCLPQVPKSQIMTGLRILHIGPGFQPGFFGALGVVLGSLVLNDEKFALIISVTLIAICVGMGQFFLSRKSIHYSKLWIILIIGGAILEAIGLYSVFYFGMKMREALLVILLGAFLAGIGQGAALSWENQGGILITVSSISGRALSTLGVLLTWFILLIILMESSSGMVIADRPTQIGSTIGVTFLLLLGILVSGSIYRAFFLRAFKTVEESSLGMSDQAQ